jgi:hypothetical protein
MDHSYIQTEFFPKKTPVNHSPFFRLVVASGLWIESECYQKLGLTQVEQAAQTETRMVSTCSKSCLRRTGENVRKIKLGMTDHSNSYHSVPTLTNPRKHQVEERFILLS